ncbi:hypothetical protein CC1G_10116 [Coprinopsis cinerea okayama7|uniref:Uncharacterized protein n=1 Tax=Coprinopsis cinerea (strain Okayama-7 / 130 / ATCC MYA-4618 / FGSC 9003) TaxID=240176 RepID=A8N413_COPC7|nr:hypothetical protein CC1G_10116 [Coprinopsis cinerea okayama7\|eukprot:XP_001829586.2 hypothetical protein CC1G_10116 [Coprinopsis cinerea okayama7\
MSQHRQGIPRSISPTRMVTRATKKNVNTEREANEQGDMSQFGEGVGQTYEPAPSISTAGEAAIGRAVEHSLDVLQSPSAVLSSIFQDAVGGALTLADDFLGADINEHLLDLDSEFERTYFSFSSATMHDLKRMGVKRPWEEVMDLDKNATQTLLIQAFDSPSEVEQVQSAIAISGLNFMKDLKNVYASFAKQEIEAKVPVWVLSEGRLSYFGGRCDNLLQIVKGDTTTEALSRKLRAEVYGELVEPINKKTLPLDLLIEAKRLGVKLEDHIPQVVTQAIAWYTLLDAHFPEWFYRLTFLLQPSNQCPPLSLCINERLNRIFTTMKWILTDGNRWIFGTTSKAEKGKKYTYKYAIAGVFSLEEQDENNREERYKELIKLLAIWAIGKPNRLRDAMARAVQKK